jgi:acetyl esterase/lipase
MKTNASFLFALLVLLAAVAAPTPVRAQATLSAADVVAMPSPAPDHVISYGPGEFQFGNLRLPPGDGPHPVLAFIHGGCWLSMFGIGHVGQTEQAIADAGYAVWSIEYRRVGDEGGGWPGTFLDVANGIDHLRELAEPYALNLSRVVASGHSAGGMLALWAAARDQIDPASEIHTPDPLPIHSVFALAPAADMEGLEMSGACGNVVGRLMGGSAAELPDRYAAGSPMSLAPVDVPQTLLVGGRDAAWAPAGRTYYNRAVTLGTTSVRLIDLPESGHFEMVVPSTSSWPAVLAALHETFNALDGAR